MSTIEEKLEKVTDDYQKAQRGSVSAPPLEIAVLRDCESDLNNAVENRQRLDAQLTENEQVQKARM